MRESDGEGFGSIDESLFIGADKFKGISECVILDVLLILSIVFLISFISQNNSVIVCFMISSVDVFRSSKLIEKLD